MHTILQIQFFTWIPIALKIYQFNLFIFNTSNLINITIYNFRKYIEYLYLTQLLKIIEFHGPFRFFLKNYIFVFLFRVYITYRLIFYKLEKSIFGFNSDDKYLNSISKTQMIYQKITFYMSWKIRIFRDELMTVLDVRTK